MKEETSKRIHHLHNIVLSMMMNLDDCIEDTEVKESLVFVSNSIVSILEEFLSQSGNSLSLTDQKSLKRVVKKLKSVFSL